MKTKHGFTLIELMIVIVLLAGIGISGVANRANQTRATPAEAPITTLRTETVYSTSWGTKYYRVTIEGHPALISGYDSTLTFLPPRQDNTQVERAP